MIVCRNKLTYNDLRTLSDHLDGGHHTDSQTLISLVGNGPLVSVHAALQLIEMCEGKLNVGTCGHLTGDTHILSSGCDLSLVGRGYQRRGLVLRHVLQCCRQWSSAHCTHALEGPSIARLYTMHNLTNSLYT